MAEEEDTAVDQDEKRMVTITGELHPGINNPPQSVAVPWSSNLSNNYQ